MKMYRYRIASIIVVAIVVTMLFNAGHLPLAAGQKRYPIAVLDQWWDPINAVEVKGDYAYLGVDYRRLRIVDISNPLAPVIASETEDLVGPGGGASIFDVEVSGNYVYVAAGIGKIQIVDVSDPLLPKVVGVISGGCAVGVAAEGSILVGAWNNCGDELGGYVYVYDISDPIHPMEIGYTFHGGFGTETGSVVAIVGDYVYAAAEHSSLLDIVPIDDPSSHILFNDWPDDIHWFEPTNVAAYNHYLYVSGRASTNDMPLSYSLVAIFDISNPIKPVWVNSLEGGAVNLIVDDDKLYRGLYVYDLVDPINPSFMFYHSVERSINDIDAQDNCVYAGAYPSGFYVFCASDPLVTPTPSPTASVEQKFYLPLVHSGTS